MLYSIKKREELENLNKLVSLENQVNEVRLKDRLGKQKFHDNVRNLYKPHTDLIKDTSRDITKTITETSIRNNIVLHNINNKLREILKDRRIISSYLLSPLSKTTNPENAS